MTDHPQARQLQPPSRVPSPRNPKMQGFARPATSEDTSEVQVQASTAALQKQQPTKKDDPTPRSTGGLRKAQIYVDSAIDNYLWEIRAAAAAQRLDVPSAAVARLAFHELMTKMSPDEVVKHLATADHRQGPGRKRR